ncbi:putative nuclease HARBI1 [Anoplophora glabripennis]|uniref:putative nuclease HARBI1 n=1 Tax=Anoplophora glabripennis TaxID=217634 RepID=UPI000C75988C|nr:putative nuclease HARBI1 [Anoplophora glabripennis]
MGDFDVELLYLELLENEVQINGNIRKNIFEELDDGKFLERYRLSKKVVIKVLEEIEPALEYATDRNFPLTPIQQLLIALRFYATGSFQTVMGDVHGISKATVCRCVKKVSEAIASLRESYIEFPQNEELGTVAKKFFELGRFPGVIGALDCTHIPILSPGGNMGEIFRNRKGYFSINVQAVCDANLLIRNIVVRWPGSVHDSTIFNNSHLSLLFENEGIPRGFILLGDNGYPLRPFLMTPLLNPETQADQRYNNSHKATRNCIERTFGILKRRFPALSLGLRTKINTSLTIIVAIVVLHNIARLTKDEDPPEDADLHNSLQERRLSEPNYLLYQNVPVAPILDANSPGTAIRNALINNHFT